MRRRRVGRPGVVGTMARTAVVAGTATTVSGNVARRQSARAASAAPDAPEPEPDWAAQQQWAAEQQAAGADQGGDMISQLKELAALRDQGILTDAEFEAQKAKLLSA